MRGFFFFPPPLFFSSSPSPTTSFSLTLLLPLVSLCCFHASCMCVSMWLDSYVMRHHSLWCVGTLPWLVRTVLTHGRCISASWQPSNPVVISVAMSPNSPQLSHYSSVLAAISYMSCVQHLIVGAKNILSHVSSMWYVENLLWSI